MLTRAQERIGQIKFGVAIAVRVFPPEKVFNTSADLVDASYGR